MKLIITLVLITIGFHSFAQTEEKINIPEGIVYNYCSKELIDKAKRLITDNIKDNSKYDLCGKVLIVGRILWSRFKELEELKKIEGGSVTFRSSSFPGKMTQNISDTRKVWDEFRKEINKQDFIIRKLNESELNYYWSTISFDIDEPLLIVETKDHRYILNMVKDGSMELVWLDEAP